ncbi:MAG TPA: ZIP family metal transporter [Longimicrobiales bacterium]
MIRALVFSALAAVANLVGGVLVLMGAGRRNAALPVLTAFGAGFMLAVAVLEMMPHAVMVAGGLMAVLGGYLAVHLTQHVLTPHFHFGEEVHPEAMVSRGVGVWALIGLLPHSFFDGVAIASGFLATAELGVLIFTAVLLHKVPTGISLASVMLASGNSRRETVVAVVVVGAATLLGAAVTPVVGVLAEYGLALAAGVTIYVAASNLIPEAQREPGWAVSGAVFLGVATFYVARLLLPEVGG